MLLIGKPSISVDHLYHGYVSHNQMVDHPSHSRSHIFHDGQVTTKQYIFYGGIFR